MLTAIGAIFSSVGFGGLVGLLGTGMQAWLNFKEKKLDREHELAIRREDRADMEKESELRTKETEARVTGEIKVSEINMLADDLKAEAENVSKSYDNDQAAYSKWSGIGKMARAWLVFVDVVRGLIRPALTIWGVVTLTWLASSIADSLGGMATLIKTDPVKAWELLLTIVEAIIFIATTAATWWFGSRKLRHQSGGGNV